MKQSRRFTTLICAAVLLYAVGLGWWATRQTAHAYEGEAYAIRGAQIITVTGATIPKGTVVVRNGLIEAVGADVAVPGDAKVIDGNGLVVYPGLFDSYTSLGLRQAETPGQGGGRGGQQQQPADPMQAFLAQISAPPSNAGLLPEATVTDQLQITAETFDAQRAAGITTALTAPRTGIFQGQSAIINLGADAAEKLILKAPVSLNIAFGQARGGYPNSLMGVFAFLRQSFLDAQHYREEWARYNKAPRGAQRPQVNKSLAALQPVINGEMPVVLNASSEREIRRAIALADEFKLKYLLAGATQSYAVADLLKSKNVTVLLSLSYPQRSQAIEDPEEEPIRLLRERAEAPKAAAALHKAGVKFAFNSGTLTRPADYLGNAARAIEAGLPKDVALKAMTIYPAEIFGVAEQLGSIEKGKIANLVIATGDIFNKDTRIKNVFVDGKLFDIKPPEPTRQGGPLAGGRGGGGRPGGIAGSVPGPIAPLAAGTWTIQVNTPNGSQPGTLKLEQNGETLTGEVTLPLGAAQITEGSIKGNEIKFNFALNMQGNQVPVSVTGKIEGSAINGAFGAMGQSFEFSGTKKPN
jgi:imidazolonepropionase-like amidohydrolase